MEFYRLDLENWPKGLRKPPGAFLPKFIFLEYVRRERNRIFAEADLFLKIHKFCNYGPITGMAVCLLAFPVISLGGHDVSFGFSMAGIAISTLSLIMLTILLWWKKRLDRQFDLIKHMMERVIELQDDDLSKEKHESQDH